MENGFFPTSPTAPRTAISIGLLDLFCALFEHSCDAVTAFAAALDTFYERRGYRLVDSKVCYGSVLNTTYHWLGSPIPGPSQTWTRTVYTVV